MLKKLRNTNAKGRSFVDLCREIMETALSPRVMRVADKKYSGGTMVGELHQIAELRHDGQIRRGPVQLLERIDGHPLDVGVFVEVDFRP